MSQEIENTGEFIYYSSVIKESDYVIEKGDYLKIDNITLGSQLPLKSEIIKNARVYVSYNNVKTFTNFTGGDPEMAGISGYYPGRFFERYPNTRIFLLGVNINL